MIQSARGCIDSSRVLPHPLVAGAAALVTPQHFHPFLCCMEGISSCRATEGRCQAVSLSVPPLGGEGSGLQPLDEDLDAGLDADDEGDGEKDPTEGDDSLIDAAEVKILQGIINLGAQEQTPTLPQLGEKWGPSHLDGSIGSDSSAEDLDAKGYPA